MPVLQGVLALGAGVLGAIGNRRARKRQQEERMRWEQLYGETGSYRIEAMGRARTNYLGALSTVRDSYNRAFQGIESQRVAARVGAQRQGSQVRADRAQSLISRHLYNTSAYDAYAGADQVSLSAGLDQIDAQAELMRAELEVRRGRDVGDLQTGLAQLEMQDYGSLADLARSKMSYLADFQYVADTDWARYAGLLGSLLNDDFGGDDEELLPRFVDDDGGDFDGGGDLSLPDLEDF